MENIKEKISLLAYQVKVIKDKISGLEKSLGETMEKSVSELSEDHYINQVRVFGLSVRAESSMVAKRLAICQAALEISLQKVEALTLRAERSGEIQEAQDEGIRLLMARIECLEEQEFSEERGVLDTSNLSHRMLYEKLEESWESLDQPQINSIEDILDIMNRKI